MDAIKASLNYLRTKDGKELDFLVSIDNIPKLMLEVKHADMTPAKSFEYFSNFFKSVKMIQLVKDCQREKIYPNSLEIRSLIGWLTTLNL